MEFVDLNRYVNVAPPGRIPPFPELKAIRPVWLTQDLALCREEENLRYARELADAGIRLVPVRRRPPEFDLPRTDFPRRVLFEMTSICNTRCRMCPQVNLKRKAVHMDAAKYLSVLDELDFYGLEGLWLYHFGESLTHPKFRELVDYAGTKKNLGIIWLSTNGILLDASMQDFLLSSCIAYLNFSLQSLSVEKYREIAPKSPAEKILANLESLVDKKRGRLLQKPFFRLQIIEQEWTRDDLDPYLSRFFEHCDLISINMLEHTDLPFNQGGKTLREHRERVKCSRLGRSDCFINSDGTVAVCDNAYNNELDIGSVWENSVHEVWNGPGRKKLLAMNDDGSLWDVPLCSECTDYDL